MERVVPKNNDFKIRILSAFCAVPLVMFFVLSGAIYFQIFCIIIYLLLMREWARLCEKKNIDKLIILNLITILINIFISISFNIMLLPILLSVAVIIKDCFNKQCRKDFVFNLGCLLITLAILECINLSKIADYKKLVVWIFTLTWVSDTCAYFVGKNLKGPKIAPKISPNKTWSGFLGGFFGGITAGIFIGKKLQIDIMIDNFYFITFFLVLLAPLGDLLESAVKRIFGVKDAGKIMPGHGGLLDRADSIIMVLIGLSIFHSIGRL